MQLDTPTRDVTIESLGGEVGALISDLDLDAIDEEVGDQLKTALHQYGVLFYRHAGDREVSPSQLIGLAEALGELFVYPYRDDAALTDDKRLTYVDLDASATKAWRTGVWHTDGTPLERPPQAALLNPVELPGAGGDTMWMSMYAAYEALSSRYQRFLDGLEALHTTDCAARQMSAEGAKAFAEGSRCVHPAVLTDPVTGRRMLYVNQNYTERLVGLSDAESASVLRMLFDHINNAPEFQIRWQWQLNDIAIWEERVTQHRALADFEGRRLLRRITINGDRPAGQLGSSTIDTA